MVYLSLLLSVSPPVIDAVARFKDEMIPTDRPENESNNNINNPLGILLTPT